MQRWSGLLWKALIVPGCVGYQLLVHSAMTGGRGSYVRLALSLLPLLGLGVWIFRSAQHKFRWTLLLVAAAIAIYIIEHEAQLGLAAAYGIPHTAIYLLLLFSFGRTLAHGHEPLITGFARKIHGALPPSMESYTRQLTGVWCMFFAAQVAVSAVLFVWAPLDVWSLFVNVLNFPLLVLMFGAEYLYRVARHRDFPHASIMKGVQMFSEHKLLSDVAPSASAPGIQNR
jgi:uncharacterized membrane protein